MKTGPYAKQLWKIIKHHHLDDTDDELARICFLIEHELLSEEIAQAYLLRIEPQVQHALDFPQPLHRPPMPDQLLADGAFDIELGHLVNASELRIGLRLRDSARSALLAGNAGSGKTTTILNIVVKVHEFNQLHPDQRICIIIFDRKLDYVHLAAELGSDWVLLDVHDSNTRVGLGCPEGVPANVWTNLEATMFGARAGMIAAWTCFANMNRWFLPLLNPEQADVLRWPSLKLLLQLAHAAPLTLWAAKSEYFQTLIQALEAATQATHLFDCFVGLDVDRDILQQGKNLVLAMPNVAPSWLRQFLIDLILGQILYSRIHRNRYFPDSFWTGTVPVR